MRLFLDIGAHHGETARVALEPEFRFDRVACFDPDASNWAYLDDLAASDPRVEVYRFGLWNQTTEAPIYNTGRVGCSLFADKPTNRADHTAIASFMRASAWCKGNWGETTIAIAKLNCEGAECDVLDDWMDTRWLTSFHALYVDFDVRKIPSQQHRQQEVLTRVMQHGHPPLIVGPDDVPLDLPREDRHRFWLRLVEASA
jgi:FkbM family methyltransferase